MSTSALIKSTILNPLSEVSYIVHVSVRQANDEVELNLITDSVNDIVVYWGDGTPLSVSSGNTFSETHVYTNSGYYQIYIFDHELNTFSIGGSDGIFEVVRRVDFNTLTNLIAFVCNDPSFSEIEVGAFANCPLETIDISESQMISLQNGIFDNISSLYSININNNITEITSVGDSIFEGLTNLTEVIINSTFSSSALVDSLLIQLDNVGVGSCMITISPTVRTTSSNTAVSNLVGRGCTVNVSI